MHRDESLTSIRQALADRMEVEPLEGTFNVHLGTGLMATRANIDPGPLLEVLHDEALQQRRQIGGFVSGVYHALLEPKRSRGPEMDFIESAGGLLPLIEVDTFSLGVAAATGERPWTRPFLDDLQTFYIIRLQRGLRVLSEAQVQAWGVSDDRITAAGRSLLFHRTRELVRCPVEEHAPVHTIHSGDGHDATRCLVIADVYYTEVGSGFRFSIPDPDHLFFTYVDSPEALAELRDLTNETFLASREPLSPAIFSFQGSKPCPIEETT